MPKLRSSWIDVAAAIVGGIVLGSGLVRMVVSPGIAAAVWTVIGVLLLWWALSDRRRERRDGAGGEPDGSRTIE